MTMESRFCLLLLGYILSYAGTALLVREPGITVILIMMTTTALGIVLFFRWVCSPTAERNESKQSHR